MKKSILCIGILFILSEFSVLGMIEETKTKKSLTRMEVQNLKESIDKNDFSPTKELIMKNLTAEQYCWNYSLATRNASAFEKLQAMCQWPSALDITKYSVKHSEFFYGLNTVTSLLDMHLVTENQIRKCIVKKGSCTMRMWANLCESMPHTDAKIVIALLFRRGDVLTDLIQNQNEDVQKILHFAIKMENSEMVNWARRAGANMKDALHTLIENNDIKNIRYLVVNCGISAKQIIDMAFAQDNTLVIRICLDLGVPLPYAICYDRALYDGKYFSFLEQYAFEKKFVPIVTDEFFRKFKINLRDEAIRHGNTKKIENLIDHKITNYEEVFAAATNKRNTRVATWILSISKDINAMLSMVLDNVKTARWLFIKCKVNLKQIYDVARNKKNNEVANYCLQYEGSLQ